ncbi:MAG: hypothetical protein E7Z73_08705 [Methanobrevibacter millerae]|uniref:Uncharacterized protein n=1 Tax=Methanobrevibacter millerae TaxID=230361 RepID=A0A8T3VCV4_9EURY|nr:hypothetical protein [Methanobrevibacter millerae]
MGQIFWLIGASLKFVGQSQNNFDSVSNCTWISSPHIILKSSLIIIPPFGKFFVKIYIIIIYIIWSL